MRLLLVEDDQGIASFVEKGLKEAGYGVDRVSSAEEAYPLFTRNDYDAGILDIMLPGNDGLSLLERIRAEGIETPIIILSAKREVDDRIRGLQKGGDDYLTKPFSFAELLARIQVLLRRKSSSLGPAELSLGDLTMNLLTREVRRAGAVIDLQPREFSLLELMLKNPGRVLSKTIILEHVWDYHFDPQTNVVDVLVSRLRSKVDKNYPKKYIHTIRGVGYVLKEQE
ncbi:MAG: response regulator transcription factor [Spirochaetales bacterium]|nr:response regulator transcription factor [Spirochaetales bacterium]